MTIDELNQDEELRRLEFPVVKAKTFLGHAGVCALPRRVVEAMGSHLRDCQSADQEETFSSSRFRQARDAGARLLNCRSDEIAFVGPTSLALSYVAGGLPMSPGENVLIYRDDYPSNVYPWMALRERGVEVRELKVPRLGCITLSDVASLVDDRTRMVALSSCHFISGWRIDIEKIGQYLRGRGIWFCVDGIQTVGAFPISVEWVDALAADAHKWLLGPCAAGVFYVRKAFQETLRPMVFGWRNVRCPNYVAQDQLVFPPDGRRYEVGTTNLVGLAGLQAAIELVLEVGVESIGADLFRKREFLVAGLLEKGYEVLNADAGASSGHSIVSFWKSEANMAELHAALGKEQIVTSLRADRAGRRYIRVSPHFYNTKAELQRVLERL